MRGAHDPPRSASVFLTRPSSLVTYHFPTRAISSVVERLLHTQEVAGSNPASRTIRFVLRRCDWLRYERSPRRQVAGSNPASRTIRFVLRRCDWLRYERSPRRQVAGSNPASRTIRFVLRRCDWLHYERSPRRQVAGSNPASRTIPGTIALSLPKSSRLTARSRA